MSEQPTTYRVIIQEPVKTGMKMGVGFILVQLGFAAVMLLLVVGCGAAIPAI